MPKFIVTYWETYLKEYEVVADNKDSASKQVLDEIFHGIREGPDECCDSGHIVEECKNA